MSNNQGKRGGRLVLGVGLLAVFVVVFVLIFMPLFNGKNGLDYLDNLYNSISKQSAYYIPGLVKQAAKHNGSQMELTLKFADPAVATRAARLLGTAGARAKASGETVALAGDLGSTLAAVLADADAMFHNQGDKLVKRHGEANPRLTLYTWWQVMNALEKSLNRAGRFAQAKQVASVNARGVETAYNYYGIKPESIGAQWFIVVLSLLFYVVYTLWYGFGVMYLFEGAGFQLSH